MKNENNIFLILNRLYSSNGMEKNYWKELLFSIENISFYQGIIQYFNQRIKNEPSNILNLDILDFLIDFGPINLLKELSKIDLMINVFNLLRKSSGSGPDVQKIGIYLTKKWFDIANKFKDENLEGFIKNFQELSNKGISFPPPGFKLNTYEKYISINEINNLLSNFNHMGNNYNIENNNNNNFINNNIDHTPFEQESKYNKNDDIPSNDIPQLNNKDELPVFDSIRTLNNDTIYAYNENNNMNYINNNNNDMSNNKSDENYFQKNLVNSKNNENENVNKYENPFNELDVKENKISNEIDNKFSQMKYSSPFDNPGDNKQANNKDENIHNSNYPDYDEKEIKINDKYSDLNVEKPENKKNTLPDINCFNTPMGNKNPIQMKMPNINKKYNTIYNNEFKSYMDSDIGKKNINKINSFNNNANNNNYNNFNNQANNQFNNQNYCYNNQNQFNNYNNLNNNMNCQNNSNNATFLYKHSMIVRIRSYNEWMDQGSNIKNIAQLKLGIKSILTEYEKIESLLQQYNRDGDHESVSIILNILSDMNQTCYRFERFVTNKPNEKFFSAFDGNIKVYNFNKEFVFANANTYEPNKYIEGLKKIGGVMKKGIFTASKVVKENTVKGINFVKEKVHKDKKIDTNQNKINSNVKDFSGSSDNYYNNNNFNNNNQNNNLNNHNTFNNPQNNYNNQNYNYNNYNNPNYNQRNNFNNNQFNNNGNYY